MSKKPKPPKAEAASEETDSMRAETAYRILSALRLFSWFKRTGQLGLIWGVFFLIIWLLRDFFPLLFLTFVFSFVAVSLAQILGRRFPRLSWKIRTIIVFCGFIGIWTGLTWFMVPQVKTGVFNIKELTQDFQRRWTQEIEPNLVEESDWYPAFLRRLDPDWVEPEPEMTLLSGSDEKEGEKDSEITPDLQENATPPVHQRTLFEIEPVKEQVANFELWMLKEAPTIVLELLRFVGGAVSLLFLATLFSFLIVLDLAKLSAEVQKLGTTRLAEFYRTTAQDIVQFSAVVGRVLEAQAVIALLNALITATGLYFLGIPNVAVLSLIVFLFGFIPVAGVFLSSVPICLTGLYVHGPGMFLILIGFITVIHMIEAYILNPRIMGAALKVNPVLVLIILVIGHHVLGVWGLLLGLPICYYFFSKVIRRESPDVGIRAGRIRPGSLRDEPAK